MTDIFKADEAEVRKKTMQQEADAQEKQKRINYGLTFSTENGFEVLRDLATFCHFLEVTFNQESERDSAFREGERRVFLYILAHLSPELQSKLMGG
ncbi:MAG TPA: hypothetical protein PKW17_12535 [Smithellaceae bacterium]|nr:hypothetical protein [Smithellaceae bacterium]